MGEKKQDAVLREIFLEGIQTDIEMAWNGEIPPSMYQDRMQDLKSAMEEKLISEQEYADLCAQFQEAINSREQITDCLYAQRCVEESNGKILYCWQGEGNSVVEISNAGKDYFFVVYLNEAALGDRAVACARQCIGEIQAYAVEHGIKICDPGMCDVPQRGLQTAFSVEGVLGRAIFELNRVVIQNCGLKQNG